MPVVKGIFVIGAFLLAAIAIDGGNRQTVTAKSIFLYVASLCLVGAAMQICLS